MDEELTNRQSPRNASTDSLSHPCLGHTASAPYNFEFRPSPSRGRNLLLQRLGTRRHDKPLEVPFAVGNGPQYDDARLLRGRARTAVPAVDESHEPSALRVHLPDSDAARLEASGHEDEGILAPRREDAAVRDPGRATRNLRDAFVGPTALRGFLCSYPGG